MKLTEYAQDILTCSALLDEHQVIAGNDRDDVNPIHKDFLALVVALVEWKNR